MLKRKYNEMPMNIGNVSKGFVIAYLSATIVICIRVKY